MRNRTLVQLNVQLSPLVRRRAVGAGDFSSNVSNAAYAAAWAPVQTQLNAEGASPGDILGAQTAFDSAFSSLTGSLGSGQEALDSAQTYVLTGQTLFGAAQQVSGLIQAGQAGGASAIPGLMESFTGVMIGTLVAAGAVTAGLGAAIAAGVAAVVGLLEAAGFFGTAPQGVAVCGTNVSGAGPVSYVLPNPSPVGPVLSTPCIGVWDPLWNASTKTSGVAPGSSLWRHFPNAPDVGGGPDGVWFVPNITAETPRGTGSVTWTPRHNTDSILFDWGATPFLVPFYRSSGAPAAIRPIDIAFPNYRHIECEQAAALAASQSSNPDTAVYAQFQQAFVAALRLNWEYAFNGLTPQPDWMVLAHALRIWNRAHLPGAGVDLSPNSSPAMNPWEDCPPSTTHPFPITPYENMLTEAAIGGLGKSPPPTGTSGENSNDRAWNAAGTALHVNTGALISAPRPPPKIVLHTNPIQGNAAGARAGAGTSPAGGIATNVAIGTAVVAGAGLLSAFLYARHKKTTTKAVLRGAWKKTGGRVHLPKRLHLPKLKGRQ